MWETHFFAYRLIFRRASSLICSWRSWKLACSSFKPDLVLTRAGVFRRAVKKSSCAFCFCSNPLPSLSILRDLHSSKCFRSRFWIAAFFSFFPASQTQSSALFAVSVVRSAASAPASNSSLRLLLLLVLLPLPLSEEKALLFNCSFLLTK